MVCLDLMLKEREVRHVNDVQKILVKLLSEIDDICERASINYSLTEKTAIMALNSGCFTCDEYVAEIAMTLDNYDRFKQIIKSQKPENRALELPEENSRLDGIYARYVDCNTSFWDLRRCNEYLNPGIGVTIRPLLETAPKGRIVKLRRIALTLNAKANLTAQVKYGSVRRRIKAIGSMIVRSVWGNASKYNSIITGKKESSKTVYYHNYNNEKMKFPRKLFNRYQKVAFEGNEFMIVEDAASLIGILEKGRDNRSIESTRFNMDSVALICDVNQPYEASLTMMKDARKLSEMYNEHLYYRKNVYTPLFEKADRQWKNVTRTKDRFSAWGKYSLTKDRIMTEYENGNLEYTTDALSLYTRLIRKYADMNMGFSIDNELFDICIALLENRGEVGLAKKARKLLPCEFRESVGEFIEREGSAL